MLEPLPQCVARIREHLSLNGLENVAVHSVALSDETGWLPIRMTSTHTGTATMTPVPDDSVQQCLQVEVRTGDAELPHDVDVIKIDVEGFELHVLRGLAKTVDRSFPVIIMEMVEGQLNRAGTSVAEVSQFLLQRGYVRYGIASVRRGLRHRLSLVPVTGDWSHDDALFVHPSRNVDLSRYVALRVAARRSGASREHYSMFCTCSRICSISTFMSTARRVVARSCDLDDSVLASRLNSCIRKSSRRPAASGLAMILRVSSR